MNIFGHIIQDDQIIGIGPLMGERSTSYVDASLYGSEKLSFNIYLKAVIVNVETDFLRLKSPDEEERNTALKKADDFKNEYNGIKKIIEVKIESGAHDFTGPR